MSLDQAEGRISARRRDVVVCIPIHGGHEHFVACLESVLEHTPAGVAILVADDASPDRRSERHLRELVEADRREVFYLRHERNVGFPANANAAFARCAPADVVLLNSDCVVAAGWLEGLREAAYIDDAIATATALTNNGTIVSVPENWTPAPSLPTGMSLTEAAAAVRSRSLRLRPRILTAIGHCMYLRRSALELVGDFDLAFSPGYGEEVDFSQRCLAQGLQHVVADEVLVFHHGGASFAPDAAPHPVQAEHEALLARRYPQYHDAVRATLEDLAAPLPRALGAARRALVGLSVTLDARGLADAEQSEALALAHALEARERARVTVLAGSEQSATAHADVVHRLSPFRSEDELASVRQSAGRLMVSCPDLLAYVNPFSFASFGEWERHRSLIRASLAAADHVSFPTHQARTEALAQGLAVAERASVVPPALAPRASDTKAPKAPPKPPAQAERLDAAAELVLLIGTDRRHENRVFALRMLEQLQRRHDWKGVLALAGPRMTTGSSAEEESAMLASDPELARSVLDLGAVDDAERAWLLERATLVLYPVLGPAWSTVPFEAGAHAVPCLWPEGSWLTELVPSSRAGIVAWDALTTSARALALMREEDARAENVRGLREAAAKLTVQATATRLLEVYDRTCDAPARIGFGATHTTGEDTAPALRCGATSSTALSEDALRLVGPDGALPAELERPVLALITHPRLGRPLLGALRAGYQGSRRLRRRTPRID